MICWPHESLLDFSRQMADAYMAGFDHAYDGKPADRPTHRELAKAYDMGSDAGMRYLQAENDRIG